MIEAVDQLSERDQRIADAVLAGESVSSVAKKFKLARSTVYYILEKTEMVEYLRGARRAIFQSTIAELTNSTMESVLKLAAIRDDATAPAAVRVKAADTILGRYLDVISTDDLAEQIETLKKQLLEITSEKYDND